MKDTLRQIFRVKFGTWCVPRSKLGAPCTAKKGTQVSCTAMAYSRVPTTTRTSMYIPSFHGQYLHCGGQSRTRQSDFSEIPTRLFILSKSLENSGGEKESPPLRTRAAFIDGCERGLD